MVYIKFGILFELFVYKIDSDGAFLCGTEILNSRLDEMDFKHPEYDNEFFKTDKLVVMGKVTEKHLESVCMVSKANVFLNNDTPCQNLLSTKKCVEKNGRLIFF